MVGMSVSVARQLISPENSKWRKLRGVIRSRHGDEQILECLEISLDKLLTEDELTELADSARYSNVAINMFEYLACSTNGS